MTPPFLRQIGSPKPQASRICGLSCGGLRTVSIDFGLMSFTVANAVIPSDIADLLLLIVAMSMLLTPGLFIVYAKVIAPRYSRRQTQDADEIKSDAKIIIAGHGRSGGIVNRTLRAAGCRDIIRETYDRSIRASRSVFEALGYDCTTATDILQAFQDFDQKTMLEMAEHYEVGVSIDPDGAYVTQARKNLDKWEAELKADINRVRNKADNKINKS